MDPLAFLAEFRAEGSEHLVALNEQLLLLERNPVDSQPVRAMFLAAHSIKGGAAMLGLSEIRELAHALEDVLAVLRERRRGPEPGTVDILFRAVDRLRVLLDEMDSTPHPSSPETVTIMAELAACATALTPAQSLVSDQSRRVLLVEDSPSVRQVEAFLLEDAGFVVDAAEAANEALEWARTVQYALVVAGVETRELRGPDLVLALRAGIPGQPVPVMLTTTDHGASSPQPTVDIVFAPKGRLDSGDFLRVVRQLTAQEAHP